MVNNIATVLSWCHFCSIFFSWILYKFFIYFMQISNQCFLFGAGALRAGVMALKIKKIDSTKKIASFILYPISDSGAWVSNFIDFSSTWFNRIELLLIASSFDFAIFAIEMFLTAGEAISSSSELLTVVFLVLLLLIDSSWGFLTSRLSLLAGSSLCNPRILFLAGEGIESALLPLFEDLH